MLLLRQAPLRRCEPGQGWQSPVTIPRLWLAAIFAACALFAAGMGVFSTRLPAPAVGTVRGRGLCAGRRGRAGLEIVARRWTWPCSWASAAR